MAGGNAVSAWSDALSDATRRQYALYGQLHQYRQRVQQAHSILQRGMEICAVPYLACSFGKDSAVLLHMALQSYPDLDVRFLAWANETEALDNYQDVIAQWQERYPRLKLTILELERETLSVRASNRFQHLAATKPADAVLLGLRAEESRGRRLTLRMHGTIYHMASGMIRICPLAWWTTDDVAAYCLEYDLPLLDTYVYDGIASRTSSRVPRDAYGIRSATLAALRRRRPDQFAQLAAAYPEIHAYV